LRSTVARKPLLLHRSWGRCALKWHRSTASTVRHSAFQGNLAQPLGWAFPLRGEHVLENCLLISSNFSGLSFAQHSSDDPRDVRLSVRGNTFVGTRFGLAFIAYL